MDAELRRDRVEFYASLADGLLDVCEDLLDRYEGAPAKFGKRGIKRLVCAYLDARKELLGEEFCDWSDSKRERDSC